MLEQNRIAVVKATDARKEPLAGEDAWAVLASAREILVASGKKVLTFDPARDDKAEILAKALGRSGNLRAPVVRLGDQLLVGFNEQLYKQWRS